VASGEYRLRVRYGKVGRLRWLSHLEVARALERSVRRAGLEFAVTQGFHPHMKIAFGPALPVGTAGEEEYYDVWLKRYTPPGEVLERLVRASAPDLAPLQAGYVSDAQPSLAAGITLAEYRVVVEGRDARVSNVQAALDDVVSRGQLAVEHKGKTKVFDLTRSLADVVRASEVDTGCEVTLTVRMGAEGSLRPELLIRSAFETAAVDAFVVRTTRMATFMEFEDDVRSRPL
jgi:radical SAM-linked protein